MPKTFRSASGGDALLTPPMESIENITSSMSVAETQAVIDTYNGKTWEKDITFNFAAGSYPYTSDAVKYNFTNIKTVKGAKLKLKGADTRSYVGLTFADGHKSDPDISAAPVSLSLAGNVITLTPADYDLSADGWGAGDILDLLGTDVGGTQVYESATISSISGTDITLTSTPASIVSFGESDCITLISNTVINTLFNITGETDVELEGIAARITTENTYAKGSLGITNCNMGFYVRRSGSAKTLIFGEIQVEKSSIPGLTTVKRVEKMIIKKSAFFYGNTVLRLEDVSSCLLENCLLTGQMDIWRTKVNLENCSIFSRFASQVMVFHESFFFLENSNIKLKTGSSTYQGVFVRNTRGGVLNCFLDNFSLALYAERGGVIRESGNTYTKCTTDYSPATKGVLGNTGALIV